MICFPFRSSEVNGAAQSCKPTFFFPSLPGEDFLKAVHGLPVGFTYSFFSKSACIKS